MRDVQYNLIPQMYTYTFLVFTLTGKYIICSETTVKLIHPNTQHSHSEIHFRIHFLMKVL